MRWSKERRDRWISASFVIYFFAMIFIFTEPFTRHSKCDRFGAEMTGGLNKMWAGSVEFYETDRYDAEGNLLPRRFPVSTPVTPAIDCCSTERRRCQPDPKLWQPAGWIELGFSKRDPFRIQFQYTSVGEGRNAQFLALAMGDRNCDGNWTYAARRARIGADGEVHPDGPMYIGDKPPAPLSARPPPKPHRR